MKAKKTLSDIVSILFFIMGVAVLFNREIALRRGIATLFFGFSIFLSPTFEILKKNNCIGKKIMLIGGTLYILAITIEFASLTVYDGLKAVIGVIIYWLIIFAITNKENI